MRYVTWFTSVTFPMRSGLPQWVTDVYLTSARWFIYFHISGVPRVWEKIEEKIKLAGQENKGLKKKVVDWAKVSFLSLTYFVLGKVLNFSFKLTECLFEKTTTSIYGYVKKIRNDNIHIISLTKENYYCYKEIRFCFSENIPFGYAKV